MYNGLIISTDEKIKGECRSILNDVGGITLKIADNLDYFKDKTCFSNYLFIIVSEFKTNMLTEILSYQENTPGLPLVFYNHSVKITDVTDIGIANKVKMIIGENRKEDLNELVEQLKNRYWRKIPYERFGVDIDSLSPRMKKAMLFIETAPIAQCNINSISEHLSISPGYFSQEFKRETDKSFRSFMQQVIDYYEKVIFKQVHLSTKNISKILGYSELSSFSRSFKKRKGISPTKYKKLMQINAREYDKEYTLS